MAELDELDEIWKGDRLERRGDAEWLATFLRNRSAELTRLREARSYVLNLDAQWGAGKTFFLTRLKQQLESAGHLAVYVNAWRDDFADDPLVAVMAAIDQTVEAHRELTPDVKAKWEAVRKKTGQIAWIAGQGLLKRLLGLAITQGSVEAAEAVLSAVGDAAQGYEAQAEEVAKAVAEEASEGVSRALAGRAEEEVSSFREQQASIQAFRDNLAEFVAAVERLQGKKAPFFVLVDELDRCRPPYAIAMLERIKHLFETPGVVFVVATDSQQLGHAIKAVYGSGFESARYLRRFFDQTYEFDEPRLDAFVAYLMERSPIDPDKLSSPWENDHAAFLTSFLAGSDSDLRTAKQVYNHLHSLASAWDEAVPIEMAVALPLILAFIQRHPISDLTEVVKACAPKTPSLFWDEVDRHSDKYVRKEESIQGLASRLVERGRQPLNEAMQGSSHHNSHPDAWVRHRFTEELQRRFQNKVDRRNPPASLIRDYPRRVSQAGRIKAPAAAGTSS